MFVEKLNKKQEGVYVIEEEKNIVSGKWEGYLDHDNVDSQSITIYTGPNFSGDRVGNYFVSISSEMPWKAYLKVFSHSEKVYITYESEGDQVEAEDINLLQEKIYEIDTEKIDAEYANETFVTKLEFEDLDVGDMKKTTYDADGSGKVDTAKNAEKLGDKLPNEYMKAAPLTWDDLKGV